MKTLIHHNNGMWGWYVDFNSAMSTHELQGWRNWLNENTSCIWETTHIRTEIIGAWIEDDEATAFKLRFGK